MMWLIAALFVAGDAKAGVMQANENLKYAEDKSLAKKELAKALWIDQDQEGAFKIFLEALLESSSQKAPFDPQEDLVYQEAFELYLNHPPDEAKEIAKKIKEKYLPIVKEQSNWVRLELLVAMAEANTFDFEGFFDRFYHAYQFAPDHFLAVKTLAILEIKLFERAKTEATKEKARIKIQKQLDKALTLNRGDVSLYRLKIAFAPIDTKDAVKKGVLNKILELSIIPPRRDTLYFLDLATDLGDRALMDRWLEKAKSWYPDSRAIQNWINDGN